MGLLRSTADNLKKGDVALLGIPWDSNSSYLRGPAKAPAAVLSAIESASANYYTESLENLDQHPAVKWTGEFSTASYDSFTDQMRELLKTEAKPFSIGGDHSITYPVIRAFAEKYPALNILHFDAHGDLYDELDGNKFSHACPFARIKEEGLCDRLVQVGVRTLTRHQKEQAKKFNVEQIEMRNWKAGATFNFEGPVYLSFDLDVLEPGMAPGLSHYEPGGFTVREALQMIQSLELDIVGADLVEYNPDRDINGITSMVAAKIIKEIIDRMI